MGGDNPLKRWNHPNHHAGFLADLAILIYRRGARERALPGDRPPPASDTEPKRLKRYYKAARATVRGTRTVWTAEDKQRFQANWGRLTHNPQGLLSLWSEGIFPYGELVAAAGQILIGRLLDLQPAKRIQYLSSVRAWATITEDDVSDLEIRWRIRDWLALAEDEVTNIPPNARLAAAAAWRVGAYPVAFQIVVDAAAAVVEKVGTRR